MVSLEICLLYALWLPCTLIHIQYTYNEIKHKPKKNTNQQNFREDKLPCFLGKIYVDRKNLKLL